MTARGVHFAITAARAEALQAAEDDDELVAIFFGGEMLNEEDDYLVVLITPAEVHEIAVALRTVTEAWLRPRYFDVDFPDYDGDKSEEDFEYTSSQRECLPELLRQQRARAAT